MIEPGSSPPSEPQAGAPEDPKPPQTLEGSDLRISTDANTPEWAHGKNVGDLIAQVESLRDAVATATPAPAPLPPAPAAVPVPVPVAPASGISADAIYSDTEGFVRSIQDYTDAKVAEGLQAASGPILQPLAVMARNSAMANPKRKSVWDAYGPEIDAVMAKIPIENRANPELWDQAARMVAGEHIDELARKEADRLIASGGDAGMITSGGVTSATGNGITASPIQALFNDDHPSIQGFKEEGMSVSVVVDHARKMGYDEDTYAKMLEAKTSRRYSTSGSA